MIANHNSPQQTVISGETNALHEVGAKLEAAGLTVKMLSVAGAFHSAWMTGAQTPLARAIAEVPLQLPAQMPVYSNADGKPYGSDEAGCRARLTGHLLGAVEFVTEIERLLADGIDYFIEVGPRSILTNLLREIVPDPRTVRTVALDPARGRLSGFLESLGQLWVAGTGLEIQRLWDARHWEPVPLGAEGVAAAEAHAARVAQWLLSGGCTRHRESPAGRTGKAAPLGAISPSAPDPEPTLQPEPEADSIQSVNTMSIHPSLASGKSAAVANAPGHQAALLAAYASHQETMRHFLSVQEKVMQQFLGNTPVTGADWTPAADALFSPSTEQKAESATAPPHSAPPIPPVAFASIPAEAVRERPDVVAADAASTDRALNRERVTQELLALVSDRTGYPVEALGLDQDVEADLGIDSIKRVEIFGAFQENLPPALGARIAADAQVITQLRTLGGWIDAVLKQSEAMAA